MARLPRYGLAGQPQHVIQRGNNRSPIFFAPEDYDFFLECLKEGCRCYGCVVHAYVLMTNHVHLLVTPQTSDGVSKLMQSLGRRYVQHINYTRQRTGTLWEGRYKAVPLDSEQYLMICQRYIELNPVRAAMVIRPGDYKWSSYAHNAQGKTDELIHEHALYLALGDEPVARRASYRSLFRTGIDATTLSGLRNSINKGWALGGKRFLARLETISQRRVRALPRGGKRKGAGRPPKEENQT